MLSTNENSYIRMLSSIVIPNHIRGENIQTFAGVMRVDDLLSRYYIPYRVHETKKGYQRELEERRVKQFASDLKESKVSVPTALLLSVRDEKYKPKISSNGFYELQLPPAGERIFFVVDGQHRLMALKKLVDEEPDGPWSQWRISVVIFFGADEDSEMNQFYIVNHNARSVKTDLALELLAERVERDSGLMADLISKKQDWKIQALRLTEKVSNQGNWYGLIQYANQAKGDTIIRSNSFVSSFRNAYKDTMFKSFDPSARVEIVNAYWAGIRKVLPECFYEPKKYALQKTVGVFVLHQLLPDVLMRVKFNNNTHYNEDAYAYVLQEALLELSGENKLFETVSGHEFWQTGKLGAASAYSSGSGQSLLAERIRQQLSNTF